MAEGTVQPMLLDLDEETWSLQLDRAGAWLGVTVQVQEKFRKFAADAAAAIREPHIKKYLEDVVGRAAAHEEVARGLARTIGREPSAARTLAGAALAKGGELVAAAVGLAGGARGDWTDLRHLLIESQDALGAFAIVEQLGYALGLPELAEPAFRVEAEKTKDHLLIQEYVLEMASVGILFHQDV